jgi:methyl-accepting chemotaxis protein
MDPLSLMASVAGITQLTGSIISVSFKYITQVRRADASVLGFLQAGKNLQGTCESIKHTLDMLRENSLQVDHSVEEMLRSCYALVKRIEESLGAEKLQKSTSAISRFKRKLTWPFTSDETEELSKMLEREKSTLHLAFEAQTLYGLRLSTHHIPCY